MKHRTAVPDGRLTRVYSPSNETLESRVDIIAIHGLGTTSPDTWQATLPSLDGNPSHQVNWLSDIDMLPAVIPNSNIYYFTWNSRYYEDGPITRIPDVAEVLLAETKGLRNETESRLKPLIFVASCFGGLILTKALEIANVHESAHRPFLLSTAGVVFLGSPLQGSEAATATQWQTMLGGILNKNPSKTLLQDLDGQTQVLRETTRRFIEMIRKPPMRMMTVCFWETLPTQILNAVLPRSLTRFSGVSKVILVKQDSACLLGFPEMSLDASHPMMNKFRGPEDANFKRVSSVLRDMVAKAQSIVEEQQQGPMDFVFSVPFSRDKNFIDRKEILDVLTQQLRSFYRVSLSGIGGVGKSQIAIEYAFRFRQEYPCSHVFWIYAASTTSFTQAYREIAGKLKIPGYEDPSVNLSKLFARWLEKTDNRWLMILDNVDDAKLFFPSTENFDSTSSLIDEPAELLNDYLPTKLDLQKYLIVTTRSRIIGSEFALGESCLEVDNFSPERAKSLLHNKLDSTDAALDQKSCDKLLEVLGCVPLAITQAAAFMRRNQLTLSEYYTALAKDETNLMDFLSEELQDARRQKGQPNSVYRTWKLSFDTILTQAPRSARLLSLMAMFDHQGIPESLLRGQFDKDVQFLTAIGDLAGYSLIEKELGGKTFALHPLVRASVQYWLQQRNQKEAYIKLSVQILAEQFPYGRHDNKTTCESLLTHAQVVLEYECSDAASRSSRSYLLYNVGRFRYGQGNYASAYRLVSEAFEIDRNLYGENEERTLSNVILLARILRAQGDYEKAEEMYLRINSKERVIGVNHPIVLDSLHGLARVLSSQGQNQKAEQIYRKVIEIDEETCGKDHPNTLISLDSLAKVLAAQGHYHTAEEIHRRVFKIVEKRLGAEHPKALTSLHNLAAALKGQGQYQASEDMFRQVMESEKRILGVDHPDTLTSRRGLAEVLRDQKQYQAAEKLFQQVIESQQSVLGTNHPETLATMSCLAWTYHDQGRHTEAVDLIKRVVEKRTGTLIGEHPRTVDSVDDLATMEAAALKAL